ncbi:saccharopine dehydrogenase NADP-binding domain-containing protein [Nocardioides sp.]|uniref:shikimate dehydrogenase family protein n=1 Tax=Nocardioides sp. TaxID=35761 RepID=UPI002628DD19|nr:saccharopine dehydrogenase NADP-binding domain-containing protein [Nocardioides sp.]
MLFFVGVSTASSSIMALFPRWAAALSLDAELRGIDVPLAATSEETRRAVETVASTTGSRGALVTTHKSNVFEQAADLFGSLDAAAQLCREVSCVVVTEGGIRGSAKDVLTGGLAIDHLLGVAAHAKLPRDVVMLGAGGASLAIAVHLVSRRDAPQRLVITDRRPERLQLIREVCAQVGTDTVVETHQVSESDASDQLVATSRPGTLVINATGLGKDLPGSPLGDAVRFPPQALAWDLNYRGDLTFLKQARRQVVSDGVVAVDGWRYFLHGWTEVISEVFDVPMTPATFAMLGDIAENLRLVESTQR